MSQYRITATITSQTQATDSGAWQMGITWRKSLTLDPAETQEAADLRNQAWEQAANGIDDETYPAASGQQVDTVTAREVRTPADVPGQKTHRPAQRRPARRSTKTATPCGTNLHRPVQRGNAGNGRSPPPTAAASPPSCRPPASTTGRQPTPCPTSPTPSSPSTCPPTNEPGRPTLSRRQQVTHTEDGTGRLPKTEQP